MRFRIRELRKAQGWTVEALADRVGISKGFLSQIETGARSPSAKTMSDLATALDLPVASLIDAGGDIDLAEYVDGILSLSPEDRSTVQSLIARLRQKPSA